MHNGYEVAFLASLSLATISVKSVLPGDFWQSAEKGGGINFQYTVTNPHDVPLRNVPVVCSWSLDQGISGYTAYTLTLTNDKLDSHGRPELANGDHLLSLSFAQLAAIPSSNPSPLVPLATHPQQYLHIEVDPYNLVPDLLKTSQSAGDERVLPLSIEVAIHGWNWNPSSNPSIDFKDLVDKLESLPQENTILYNRVVGFAPRWDSLNDAAFTTGFAALLTGNLRLAEWELYQDPDDYASAQDWLAVGERIGTILDSAVNDEASTVARTLYNDYLHFDDPASPIEHIELIGHSRGGGVGALLVKYLRNNLLTNATSLITLDGYDSTWSYPDQKGYNTEAGALSPTINIAAIANELAGRGVTIQQYVAQYGVASLVPAVADILSYLGVPLPTTKVLNYVQEENESAHHQAVAQPCQDRTMKQSSSVGRAQADLGKRTSANMLGHWLRPL